MPYLQTAAYGSNSFIRESTVEQTALMIALSVVAFSALLFVNMDSQEVIIPLGVFFAFAVNKNSRSPDSNCVSSFFIRDTKASFLIKGLLPNSPSAIHV